MTTIRVEKNVPMPPRARTGGRRAIYPWKELNVATVNKDGILVGDSFVFPKKTKKTTASSLAYKAGKLGSRQFAIRAMEEGIRVWRTK